MRFVFLIIFSMFLFAKVNINTANMQKLHTLPGIGHTKALAIIEYRKKHPFKKIEDILKVKGIGKKTFDKIKDEIEVK